MMARMAMGQRKTREDLIVAAGQSNKDYCLPNYIHVLAERKEWTGQVHIKDFIK